MMRTQIIDFTTRQVPSVFPNQPADLGQALSELHLDKSYPVIVLIGDEIDAPQADATRQAIQTISRTAHDMNALVICGGTDTGIEQSESENSPGARSVLPVVPLESGAYFAYPSNRRKIHRCPRCLCRVRRSVAGSDHRSYFSGAG